MPTEARRLRRQFSAITRAVPASRRFVDPLLRNGMRLVRVPVALLLIAGGIFSFLPVLGLWMLPFGILLLAVDVPFLQRPTSAFTIRLRRRIALWRRRRSSGNR